MPSDSAKSTARRLGLTTAVLLVVANMIGTGVFTTTGFLVRDIQSSLAVLLAWVAGGMLAVCGALAYGELVTALPRNGGEYNILSRVFHPAVGFLAGWISLLVGFSAPIAASALAFGIYFHAVVPAVPPLVAAVVLIGVLACLHATHVGLGSGVQNVFTVAKVLLILGLIVGGLVVGNLSRPFTGGSVHVFSAMASPAFAIGLIFVAFAYSGWNGAAYIAGEVRKPAKNLPRALVLGTAAVVILYVGLNVIFLAAAPPSKLSGVLEVGHVASVQMFGARAGSFLSAVIALALVSSVSAMIMVGSRVYQAMGEDYPRLRFLQHRTRLGTPATAVLLQAGVALVLAVTATFEAILVYMGFALSISAGLTVIGVFHLRRKEPDLARPYKTWGYPVTPLLFVALSGWMVIHTIIQKPIIALFGVVTIVAGMGLYLLVGRPQPKAVASESRGRIS